MNRLLCLLFLVLLITTGCGDNNGTNDDEVVGFTTAMVDDDTYYLSYAKNNETVQSTVVLSGSTATVSDEWFDADGIFQYRGTYSFDLVLNDDGTLTATSSTDEGTDTLSETSTGSDYSAVEWTYGTETWTDNWATEKPEDWYSIDSFTISMINNDTYYVRYQNDMQIIQETIIFSVSEESGYSVSVSQDIYEDESLESTSTTDYNVTLNNDGTLSVVSDETVTTFTLISSSSDSLLVHGADEEDTFTGNDSWYFTQPDGWL